MKLKIEANLYSIYAHWSPQYLHTCQTSLSLIFSNGPHSRESLLTVVIHYRAVNIGACTSSGPRSEMRRAKDTFSCYKRKRDGRSLLAFND